VRRVRWDRAVMSSCPARTGRDRSWVNTSKVAARATVSVAGVVLSDSRQTRQLTGEQPLRSGLPLPRQARRGAGRHG